MGVSEKHELLKIQYDALKIPGFPPTPKDVYKSSNMVIDLIENTKVYVKYESLLRDEESLYFNLKEHL